MKVSFLHLSFGDAAMPIISTHTCPREACVIIDCERKERVKKRKTHDHDENLAKFFFTVSVRRAIDCFVRFVENVVAFHPHPIQ
jgi:hypothetical protein